jgi:hypothetical protein
MLLLTSNGSEVSSDARIQEPSLRADVSGGVGQSPVDLGSHVPFETPDDLPLGSALGGPPGEVVDRRWMTPSEPDQNDPMKGRVGVPVPAAVQPVSRGLAGGCLDRRESGQLGKRVKGSESTIRGSSHDMKEG